MCSFDLPLTIVVLLSFLSVLCAFVLRGRIIYRPPTQGRPDGGESAARAIAAAAAIRAIEDAGQALASSMPDERLRRAVMDEACEPYWICLGKTTPPRHGRASHSATAATRRALVSAARVAELNALRKLCAVGSIDCGIIERLVLEIEKHEGISDRP